MLACWCSWSLTPSMERAERWPEVQSSKMRYKMAIFWHGLYRLFLIINEEQQPIILLTFTTNGPEKGNCFNKDRLMVIIWHMFKRWSTSDLFRMVCLELACWHHCACLVTVSPRLDYRRLITAQIKRSKSQNTYLPEEQQPPSVTALPQSSPLPEEQHCTVGALDSGSTGALIETEFINTWVWV